MTTTMASGVDTKRIAEAQARLELIGRIAPGVLIRNAF